MMSKPSFPRRLWCYGMPYLAKVIHQTARNDGNLDGSNPIEKITGDTHIISEYIDSSFYDLVIYNNETRLGEVYLGRFLDVSHGFGSLMLY